MTVIALQPQDAYAVTSRTTPGRIYTVRGVGYGSLNDTTCTCAHFKAQRNGVCAHRRMAHWLGSTARLNGAMASGCVADAPTPYLLAGAEYRPTVADVFARVAVAS